MAEASTGEEALGFLAESPVDLIVSDLRLGEGIDGTELIAKATIVRPRAKTILMSGDFVPRRYQKPPCPVLLKPFRSSELLETADRVLRGE